MYVPRAHLRKGGFKSETPLLSAIIMYAAFGLSVCRGTAICVSALPARLHAVHLPQPTPAVQERLPHPPRADQGPGRRRPAQHVRWRRGTGRGGAFPLHHGARRIEVFVFGRGRWWWRGRQLLPWRHRRDEASARAQPTRRWAGGRPESLPVCHFGRCRGCRQLGAGVVAALRRFWQQEWCSRGRSRGE